MEQSFQLSHFYFTHLSVEDSLSIQTWVNAIHMDVSTQQAIPAKCTITHTQALCVPSLVGCRVTVWLKVLTVCLLIIIIIVIRRRWGGGGWGF